jgi:DNA-binding beta-propeller fold protein YncE
MRFAAILVCYVHFASAQQQAPTPSTPDNSTPRLTPTFVHDPPRIDLTDPCGKVVSSHPLLKQTKYPLLLRALNKLQPFHVTSPDGTVVYVLQTGQKSARVSAFDLTSGAALGNVDIAAVTSTLLFTSDASRLIAFGAGNPLIKGKEQHTSVVTVIDRATLKVAFAGNFGQFANMMRYVPQLDRMLVLDSTKTSLWFIDPGASSAPAPIQLRGVSDGIAISRDGKELLTLVRNTKNGGKKAIKGGALNQFDIATGRLLHTSEKLGDAIQLIRLGDGDEYWVVLKGRMQRVTREGEPSKAVISFQKEDKELGRGLGGLPGPSLDFGDQLAIEVVKPDGSLAHEVALVDPEAGHIDGVALVGRPGVRRGKTAKRWAIAIGLSAAMGAAGGAANAGAHPLTPPVQTPIFLPGSASRISGMAVGASNRTLYVMDAESDDVTAVKPDGTVADILPIKSSGAARLWRSPGSPFVYHFGVHEVTVISDENKITKQIPIARGFTAITVSARDEFYFCNKQSCEIWSALTAASVRTVDRQKLGATLAHGDEAADDAETGEAASDDESDATQPCRDIGQSIPQPGKAKK